MKSKDAPLPKWERLALGSTLCATWASWLGCVGCLLPMGLFWGSLGPVVLQTLTPQVQTSARGGRPPPDPRRRWKGLLKCPPGLGLQGPVPVRGQRLAGAQEGP